MKESQITVEDRKSKRKEKAAIVVSNKMQKTVVVRVDTTYRHEKYGKVITKSKKYYAHTEKDLPIGEKVIIEETRPLSKLKRWKVKTPRPQIEE